MSIVDEMSTHGGVLGEVDRRSGSAGFRIGVVVTRSEGGDGPLTSILEKRGARVLPWETIAFVPPDDDRPLTRALLRLDEFDWICFSSPRAVEAVVGRVGTLPAQVFSAAEGDEAGPSGLRVAAVGPTTAATLRAGGWPVHRVPEKGSGEALVETFRIAGDAPGARVLFPAGSRAREAIPSGLARLGALVEQVLAYRLINLPLDAQECRVQLDRGEVQVLTFASPSAMEGLRVGLGEDLFERLSREIPAAAMGPTTEEALAEVGWRRVVTASKPSLDGLASAALEAARRHWSE